MLGLALAGLLGAPLSADDDSSLANAEATPPKSDRHGCCATPGTGTPTTPPAAPANPTTPRSSSVTPTTLGASGFGPTTWQHYWRRHREELLGARPTYPRTGPRPLNQDRSPPRVDTAAIDALLAALADSRQPDLQVASVIGLGRAAKALPNDERVLPAIRARIRDRQRDVRDAATLALGISGSRAAIPELLHLIHDSDPGRQLVGRKRVDTRTRALAGYGLGLLVRSVDDTRLRRLALEAMFQAIERESSTDLLVAWAHGVRLMATGSGRPVATSLRLRAVAALWGAHGQTNRLGRADVLPQIGRILGRDLAEGEKRLTAMCASLLRRGSTQQTLAHRSAIMALSSVVRPREIASGEGPLNDLLVAYARDGRNHDARGEAWIALGRIGGESNIKVLRHAVRTGRKNTVRPWAAIGLGIATRVGDGAPDPAATRDLLAALHNTRASRGAIALGLGLHGDPAAEPAIRKLLRKSSPANEAEFFCDALALLGARGAEDDLKSVLKRGRRQPSLAAAAAGSLGYLGFRDAARLLLAQLDRCGSAACEPLATTLGWLADDTVADALVGAVRSSRTAKRERAFAAIALGGLADPDPLSWKAQLFLHGEPPMLASR